MQTTAISHPVRIVRFRLLLVLVSVLISIVTETGAATSADREHKVHNIVLYPDKHSWCKTTPIEQVISVPGYGTVTLNNNVCVGACFSYSIPFSQPAEPGEIIGPYCDSCQPVETKCYHVFLKNENESMPHLRKEVQLISSCNCTSCTESVKSECGKETPALPDEFIADGPHSIVVNKTYGEDELLHVSKHSFESTKYILKKYQLKKDWTLTDGNLKLGQNKLNEFLKSLSKKDDYSNDQKVHYVNEEIQDYFNKERGHLKKGPHGSLVMYDDKSEPQTSPETVKSPTFHLEETILSPNNNKPEANQSADQIV